MRRRNSAPGARAPGFTLVEIVVVMGIILVLCAVLWFALGPAVRAKGWEARIRSDLHQIAVAIDLYRQDYDDRLPLSLASLPKTTPQKIDGWPQVSSYSLGYPTDGTYKYMMSHRMQVFQERFAKVKWRPEDDPIVLATFFRRATGARIRKCFEPVEGQIAWHKMDEVLVLGAFVDGSVRWTDIDPQWHMEFADRQHLLGGLK